VDKNRIKTLNSKIINSFTPFSQIRYDPKRKIDIFVGREEYLRLLTEALYKSIFNDQSFGIKISGPGGCGKSTLLGYFIQLINSGELYTKNYCTINKDDCLFITCFIDAPKGELTTLRYFWTSIIDSLAEENIEFSEKFAVLLIRKCLDVLWKRNFKREEIKSLLNPIIPNFEQSIRFNSLTELINLEKFYNILITNEELLEKIRNLIKNGWRILQKYEVELSTLSNFGLENRKCLFKFERQYIDLLFDSLSSDPDKSDIAQNILKGANNKLLKSDSDVINLLNWLTQTWEWIEEKPICFLVGIDNIGYLTVDLDNEESAYIPFIQTLLQMRNSLKRFLFVLIGTNEDWRKFNNYIGTYQDYRSQLQGFFINNIDLTRLKLDEVIEALTLIMNKFWQRQGVINPSNPIYPFSKKLFSYLYDFHAHEYREILNTLSQIWASYKSNAQVIELADPFSMIKFIRIKTKETKGIPAHSQSYQFKELYFNQLIEWEKEQIKNWFFSIKSRHIGAKQSELVEKRLTEALRIIQEKEVPKQIDWVEKNPSIKITTEQGNKTRYPDVYVKLSRQSLSDKQRTFEIQVKMYDQNKFVKLKDIESSLELLERAYTDALLFLIIGAGLEEKAIDKINELGLDDRILYYKPLHDDQIKALAFLVCYENITGRKITVNVVKEILEILFEQPWEELIERIRNIGSYRDLRITRYNIGFY